MSVVGLEVGGRRARARQRITAALLAVAGWLAVLGAATPAGAAAKHAAMVIDGNSGHVLYAQSADEPRYPASLTKMMTLYIVFELMEQGRLKPDTMLQVSREAASVSPSKLGLKPGSEIALSDAIAALVTKSANDVAVAIAEHIAGSEAKFAALMTQRAHQIGMRSTTFRNANGLPDAGQTTTARDMLTLALRLNDDFPQRYRVFSMRAFTWRGQTHRNHNTMLNTYPGMDGLKTGYTGQSGFNLVTSVRRNGRHLVAAVFGGSSAAARNAMMRVLLDRSLPAASTQVTRKPVAVARLEKPGRMGARTSGPALVESVRPAVAPARKEVAAAPAAEPAVKPRAKHAKKEAAKVEAATAAAPEPVGTWVETPRAAAPVAAAEPATPPSPASAAAQEPAPPVTVRVARVRPVVVAPRLRGMLGEAGIASAANQGPPERSGPSAEPQDRAPVAAVPAAEPTGRLAAFVPVRREMLSMADAAPPARTAVAPSAAPAAVPAETVAEADPVAEPAPEPRAAAASGRKVPTPASPRLHVTAAVAPVIRGAHPSSLQAQADRLRAQPRLPEVRTAGHRRGGVMIQVGAYATEGEAQRQLRTARDRASVSLGNAEPLTQPVQSNGRQLYRARFAGLDAVQAASACTELRRHQIDCHVSSGP